jgi:hypothetical protein
MVGLTGHETWISLSEVPYSRHPCRRPQLAKVSVVYSANAFCLLFQFTQSICCLFGELRLPFLATGFDASEMNAVHLGDSNLQVQQELDHG